ncbi:MAG TPA: hypothetical protein VFG86_06475 [Chloroflexota bacterium]|nr:hypothetical protein [Chloroflexota bacterium]
MGRRCGQFGEFNAYLDREHADPTDDSVGYRQIPSGSTTRPNSPN